MLIIKKKKTCHLEDLNVPVDSIVKMKEREKMDKYFDLAWELRTVDHEGDEDTNFRWCTWNSPQGLRERNWKNWKSEKEWKPSRPDQEVPS